MNIIQRVYKVKEVSRLLIKIFVNSSIILVLIVRPFIKVCLKQIIEKRLRETYFHNYRL